MWCNSWKNVMTILFFVHLALLLPLVITLISLLAESSILGGWAQNLMILLLVIGSVGLVYARGRVPFKVTTSSLIVYNFPLMRTFSLNGVQAISLANSFWGTRVAISTKSGKPMNTLILAPVSVCVASLRNIPSDIEIKI